MSRRNLLADPQQDAISALFWCLKAETDGAAAVGFIAVVSTSEEEAFLRRAGLTQFHSSFVDCELELINTFVDMLREWDPEVLVGFEIQTASWGYLLERATHEFGINSTDEFMIGSDLITLCRDGTLKGLGKNQGAEYGPE